MISYRSLAVLSIITNGFLNILGFITVVNGLYVKIIYEIRVLTMSGNSGVGIEMDMPPRPILDFGSFVVVMNA